MFLSIHDLKVNTLKNWLVAAGAEILKPTNEWEVIRFRAGPETGIVYKNSTGRVRLTGAAQPALDAFFSGSSWRAAPTVKRARLGPHVEALLARDGDTCWLCGKQLKDDITLEHLVPVAHQGPNHMSNLALTHKLCNTKLGHLCVVDKVKLKLQYENSQALSSR